MVAAGYFMRGEILRGGLLHFITIYPLSVAFSVFLLKPDECTYGYAIFAAGRTFEALHPAGYFLKRKWS